MIHSFSLLVTKKKKKGRFDGKESLNNDMLSAFVDRPKETASEPHPEPVKPTQKPPEETTWEDKVHCSLLTIIFFYIDYCLSLFFTASISE